MSVILCTGKTQHLPAHAQALLIHPSQPGMIILLGESPAALLMNPDARGCLLCGLHVTVTPHTKGRISPSTREFVLSSLMTTDTLLRVYLFINSLPRGLRNISLQDKLQRPVADCVAEIKSHIGNYLSRLHHSARGEAMSIRFSGITECGFIEDTRIEFGTYMLRC